MGFFLCGTGKRIADLYPGIDTITTQVHRVKATIVAPLEHGQVPISGAHIMKMLDVFQTILVVVSLSTSFMGAALAERSEVSGDVFYTVAKRTTVASPHNTG